MNDTTRREPPDFGTGNTKLPEQVHAPATQPELLTKAEVAEMLGVCQRTIDTLMRQRRISFVRFSRRLVRFPRREILRHIEQSLTIRARGSEGGRP
jgi:excisionase family DNA binding protein